MPSTPSSRIGRVLSLLPILGLGIGLSSVHVLHLWSEQETLLSALVGVLVPLGFSTSLVVGGLWVWRTERERRYVLRIGFWTVFLATVLAVGQLTTIIYQLAEGVEMSHWVFVIVNAASAGGVLGFVVGVYDTRQRVARNREAKLRSQLTVLNRVLRHDIRNGATVIQGRAELIEERLENGDHARRIRERATDLVRLGKQARAIEDLKDGGGPVREVVDIESVLEEEVGHLRETYPEARVSTSIAAPEEVVAHPLVGTAVANLLENAVRHADRPDPRIEIGTELVDHPGGDRIEVHIADDGPGIPEEEVTVLERGYETPLDHTSGLGLWLVNWVVTESGGSVQFEENTPRGSIVRIVLDTPTATRSSLPRLLEA